MESVRDLKQQLGGDIIIWGSLWLTHDLLRAGLVDDIRMLVVPVAPGEGRPVFPEGEPPLDLTLIKATFFPSGIVRQCYTVGRTASNDDPEKGIRQLIADRFPPKSLH